MSRRVFLALGAAALVLTGCVANSVPPLPTPPTVKDAPSTTSIPDYSSTSIAPVKGVTTIPGSAVKGGNANLKGRVLGPSGPIGDANVHIERFVGDASAAIDVTSAADGTYTAPGVIGGRYRIRAYRPPDLTMTTALTFFLGNAETKTQDLTMAAFNGGSFALTGAIAPNPPILGQSANVVLVISTRGVDGGGIARAIPAAGVPVSLVSQGGRPLTSAPTVLSDASGRVQWSLRCDSLDNQDLTATLPDGSTQKVGMTACSLPPTTTTSTSIVTL